MRRRRLKASWRRSSWVCFTSSACRRSWTTRSAEPWTPTWRPSMMTRQRFVHGCGSAFRGTYFPTGFPWFVDLSVLIIWFPAVSDTQSPQALHPSIGKGPPARRQPIPAPPGDRPGGGRRQPSRDGRPPQDCRPSAGRGSRAPRAGASVQVQDSSTDRWVTHKTSCRFFPLLVHQISTEDIISLSYDTVWFQLVSVLSCQFYSVNCVALINKWYNCA